MKIQLLDGKNRLIDEVDVPVELCNEMMSAVRRILMNTRY